jgi:hypothetical protein
MENTLDKEYAKMTAELEFGAGESEKASTGRGELA